MNTRKKNTKQKLMSSQTAADPVPFSTESGPLKAVTGAKVSRGTLRYQTTKLVDRARAHQAEMTDVGWPPTRTDSVVAAQNALDAITKEEQALKLVTQVYREQVAKGLTFREELVADIRVAALTRPGLLTNMPLNLGKMNNGYKLAQWFVDVQGLMEALRAELAMVSPTVDWFAAVAAQQTALASVLGTIGSQRAKRSELARKRLAARNTLALAIESLHVYAGKAFVHNDDVLKEFEKGSGKRKSRAKKSDPVSTPDPAEKAAAVAVPSPEVKPAAAETSKPG